MIELRAGDVLERLREIPDASVDAVVTDPPYGLAEHRVHEVAAAMGAWCSGDRERVPDGRGFMGKDWDKFVPPPAVWDECLRVLKPGGHLLAFAGSRTYDLMGLSIRLAGFEVRDGLQWLYGSGFPKGIDVGKAIDKAGGGSPVEHGRILRAARERVGLSRLQVAETLGCQPQSVGDWEDGRARVRGEPREVCVPSPEYRDRLAELLGYTADERRIVGAGKGADSAGLDGGFLAARAGVAYASGLTPEAARWNGWNTSLKPAHEPIVLARKPLSGTVAATVLEHGTGALNIGACRVATSDDTGRTARKLRAGAERYRNGGDWNSDEPRVTVTDPAGRWPANVLLCHLPECHEPGACAPGCVVAELDAQSGQVGRQGAIRSKGATIGDGTILGGGAVHETTGYADTGGASRFFPQFRYQAKAPSSERPKIDGKGWPTVKPLSLMRWLVRLVTPPGGLVLDPFAGTGTTLQAAEREEFSAVGIERDPFALALARQRLDLPEPAPTLSAVPLAELRSPTLIELVRQARDLSALVMLYRAHCGTWTQDVNDAAKRRRAELESAASTTAPTTAPAASPEPVHAR